MQQKIVVRVTMNDDKKSRKALKIAVSLDGKITCNDIHRQNCTKMLLPPSHIKCPRLTFLVFFH